MVTDIDGNTIAAHFTGKFGLSQRLANLLLTKLRAWHDDTQAAVPPPSDTRSFGNEFYVSDFIYLSKLIPSPIPSKTIFFLKKIQDGGIHYGVAVPQGGDTPFGQRTLPSKYKEVQNLHQSRPTLTFHLRHLEQTLAEMNIVNDCILPANEAASSADYELKKK